MNRINNVSEAAGTQGTVRENINQNTAYSTQGAADKLFAQMMAQQLDQSLLALADFSAQDGEQEGRGLDQTPYLALLAMSGQLSGSMNMPGQFGAAGINSMGAGYGYANMPNLSSGADARGSNAAQTALTRMGDPYSQPLRGSGDYVDCSYLTQWAYRSSGVSLPSTAAEQARFCKQNGYEIQKQELAPGDLVFWQKAGCNCGRYDEIHHVGIYLGDGKVVEASSSAGKVVVNDLWGENGGKWQVAFYARPY